MLGGGSVRVPASWSRERDLGQAPERAAPPPTVGPQLRSTQLIRAKNVKRLMPTTNRRAPIISHSSLSLAYRPVAASQSQASSIAAKT